MSPRWRPSARNSSSPSSPVPWIAVAVTLATLIAVVDVLFVSSLVLIGLLSTAPLIAALAASVRQTALVGAYALALALTIGVLDGITGSGDWLLRVVVVLLVSALATWMAAMRARTYRAGVEARRIVSSVFSSALDCIISVDGDGNIVDLNASAERTFGYRRDQALGEPLCDLIIPERFREAHRAGMARMERGEPGRILDQRVEMVAVRANGEEFPIELTVTSAATDPPLFTGFLRDITDRRAAEAERERHERHAAFLNDAGVLLESSLDYEATLAQIARLAVPRLADWAFVEIVQEDGSIERLAMAHSDPAKEVLVREYDRRYPINPDAPEGSAKVIRTGRPDLLTEIPDEMLEAVAEDPEHLRILRDLGFRSAMVVPLRARGRTLGDLALVSAESGRLYDEQDLAVTQELAVRCALAIDNARLYEEARLNEARFQDQALRDALTGLANRTLFLDRLSLALARADRRPGTPALFFFDLDDFKPINDELGHHVGDEVLRAVARRLETLFRSEDTVCRFGGDEFAILCEDIHADSVAVAMAGRLVEALGEPIQLDARSVTLGVSLGVALSRDAKDTPEGLLRVADSAMYEAKREGGGRSHLAAALSDSDPATPRDVRGSPTGAAGA